MRKKKDEETLKCGVSIVEMLILSIISESDCYGYQISQLIKKYSDGALSVTVGTLYPSFYKLEEAGYITGTKTLVGKRLTRVYYHIEEPGREYLKTLIDDFNSFNGIINGILKTTGQKPDN